MSNKTLKDSAIEYQPKSAKNITELQSVDVNLLIQTENGKDAEGLEFSYNYVEVSGERYRVPDSVLSNLKAILAKKPTLKSFSVSKTGEGRLTKYTVIPLD